METPADPPAPVVLRARGIRVVVEGERSRALRRHRPVRGLEGFSLDVRAGEVVHLVGDPQSGVHEAIEVLSGDRSPDAGRIEVLAESPSGSRRSSTELRERVARLDRLAVGGPGRRSVVDAVAEVVRRGAPGTSRSLQAEQRADAEELLGFVGVPADVAAARVRDLPDDLVDRVGLAVLMARRPAVVVHGPGGPSLGVPADVLDSVLMRLREGGAGLILAATALPEALGEAERVHVLCGGRVVEVLGGPDLAHPLHPWTRALAAGVAPIADRPDVADPGCPFRHACDRAQDRCAARMPELVPPLGASHPVACWFPEDPRGPGRPAGSDDHARVAARVAPLGDEPTAHEFVEG